MSSFLWKGHFYFQTFRPNLQGGMGQFVHEQDYASLLPALSLMLSFDKISIRISLFIQGFGWLKYWHGNSLLSRMPLKHLGLADLPLMKGLSFPPLALVKNKHVSLSFDFLPPVQIWEASVSDLFGRALKNWPVSSTFQILQGCHPCRISGRLSVHESSICSLTSPDSTEINFALKCMPVLFLKRSSHPFQALNCSPETWHMLIDWFLISPQGDSHSKTITRAITVPYSLVVS